MVKQWLAALLSAGVLASALGGVAMTAAAADKAPVPLRLRYDVPAATEELPGDENYTWAKHALPIGNGFIGGMVFGDVNNDRVMVNEHTLWSGGPAANVGSEHPFDGGITDNYTKDEIHANLQKLRRNLQNMVDDFRKNKLAYLDENGNVVSENYGTLKDRNQGEVIDVVNGQSGDPVWEDKEMQELIMSLRGEKDYFGSYQMISNLNIKDGVAGDYTDYERSLDLRTGVSSMSYKKGGVSYRRDYFVNNPSNVMVVRLSASEKGKLTNTIQVTTEQTNRTITADAATGLITMVGQPSDQKAEGLHFAQQVKVIPVGGTMTAAGKNGLTVTGADEIVVILSTGTNYIQCDETADLEKLGLDAYFSKEDPLIAVADRVEKAAKLGYEKVLEEHLTDYDSLFGRVEFMLDGVTEPDMTTAALLAAYQDENNTLTEAQKQYLELVYYQFGRYLLISSSREGSLPANLQGIWADHLNPSWGADYHTNINVQMNYWLAEQTNLAECHMPVIEYTQSLVPSGKNVAKYYYCKQDGSDVRGWTIGHENNIWNNTAPGVWYWGYYFPEAAAWMCQDIWEHYAFTLDKEFLADNYDTMLSAALFWVDNLWLDSDGTLVANPSYSPEHGPYSLGSSCDQQIIWELFDEVLKAAKVLGKESSELQEVAAAKEKLYLPKIGLSGIYLEWKEETALDISGDNHHRHTNQLYGLHPGSLVVAGRSDEDDEKVEAMKKVLQIRGDGGTGWSKAWKINFWARLRDGDHAHTMVNQILKESTYENLFDYHPPYQIDGNLGATAGMTEMLLQSQGDSIDLMAAMPNAWGKGGSVSGLKARGNFTVNMTWKAQQLTAATVESGAGAPCTLNYHGLSKTVVKDSKGREVKYTVLNRDTITFETVAGEVYTITEIPQDKKFSDARQLLKTNFNNLYTAALEKATGCPDDNGAYVESFTDYQTGLMAGLVQGDVVRALNGQPIKAVEDFVAMYKAVKPGEPVVLSVWRGGKLEEISFSKIDESDEELDAYHALPGMLYASGAWAMFDGAVTKMDNNAMCVKGPGLAQYEYLYMTRNPSSIRIMAKSDGKGKVIVHHDSEYGDPLAEFTLDDTAGAFKELEGVLQNLDQCKDYMSLCVELVGDVTLQWIDFGGDYILGDADGSGEVTTADARMILQYCAEIETERQINVAAADVTGEGDVTTADARRILQYCAEIIKDFSEAV